MSGQSARVAAATASRAGAARNLSARAGRATARQLSLRLVTPAQQRARRAPFVVVVIVVVSAGLLGLIVMSTALQAQSFEIAKLKSQTSDLSVEQQRLQREVDRLQTPATIAHQAVLLGMVPNANPAFLRLSDGRVIGVPEPAEKDSNVSTVDR